MIPQKLQNYFLHSQTAPALLPVLQHQAYAGTVQGQDASSKDASSEEDSWVDMASEDGLITLLGDPDMLKNIKENDTQLDNFTIKAYGLVR